MTELRKIHLAGKQLILHKMRKLTAPQNLWN